MAKKNITQQHQDAFQTSTPLALTSPDGADWMTFPAEITLSLRRMLSRLARKGNIPKVIAFVSPLRQEGVTYVSRAFGTVMAEDLEASVCVVELNWYWPSEQPAVVAEKGGVSSVLMGETTLDRAVVPTGKKNVSLLPAGKMPAGKRSGCARSTALCDLIAELGQQYDHLLLDIPSVLACSDAVPLASLATSCCLVVHQGVTPLNDVRSALDELDHLNMIGMVLNKVRISIPQSIYQMIGQ